MEKSKNYKGIILAGGSGTRLFPITLSSSKQLLPIYDKPMIYYPLSVLMMAGIKDISVITTKEFLPHFKKLLGNGENIGINLKYTIQSYPNGLAEAFILEEEFIEDDNVALILGDNIFYGNDFSSILKTAIDNEYGATVFGYYVNDPERYGVVDFNQEGIAVKIEEKPLKPKSNYAVTGLYFYDNSCVEKAKNLKPSERGELEITDLNNLYLKENKLYVETLRRGFTWLDTGTFDSMLESSQFVKIIQEKQGLKIACIEEIALKSGWINLEQIEKESLKYKNNSYGQYLKKLISQNESN